MARHIVACGGGGWMADGRIGALERYILGLCASERPRVCFLPTASGDSDGLVTRFYEAFADVDCEPSHVALFRPHPQRVAERLLAADAIYVGGGSTANLIAIWEAHRLDAVLRRAWDRGVVLSGVSAGAICWFEWGVTDSLGAGYAPGSGGPRPGARPRGVAAGRRVWRIPLDPRPRLSQVWGAVAVLDAGAVRQRILSSARRMGLEPQLRRAQDAFAPRSQLRNRRDDAHLYAIMAAVLTPEANCIDIGANAGDTLRVMVRHASEGHHIAYEPLPELADSLAERFPGVDVRNVAISDTAGEAPFYRDTASDSRSSLRPSHGCEPFTVRVETLDDDLPEGYRPDLVKIDVEGAELAVLRSGAETLARHRPYIVIEHGSSAAAFGTTHRMIHDFLAGELGMRIFDMDGDGPFDADEFDLVADPPGDRWNFIACP